MAGSKQLEQTSKSIDSSAHMITTARVPADKPIRIAFSLNDSPDDASPENFSLAFPELDQQLQPLPPCHDSKESMQVYKQHCKIAEEYNEVKKEIALLEERNRNTGLGQKCHGCLSGAIPPCSSSKKRPQLLQR
ncbi:MAP3K7 C-terminal-like protein isoform X4 [Aphelocoma coerulescens]|uniref:MAP3K7 C-terminal-like protein isoform X4 n=1 Tax=Aphelocoma coerulescens TaxID=39617 RepID=UPI00360540CC